MVRLRRSLQVLATLAVAGVVATDVAAAPPKYRDWLDIRRGGAPAILADARRSAAPVAWTATYEVAVPATHPLAKAGIPKISLRILRSPTQQPPAGKQSASAATPALTSRMLVQFLEPAALKGVGIALDKGKAWVRLPGGKPKIATTAEVTQNLPGLNLPLSVFVAGDWTGNDAAPAYDVALEGEFGDNAIFRCKPGYEAGPKALAMKAGISKRFGTWTVGELDDRQGKAIGRIEWLDVAMREGVPVPDQLRLLPMGGDDWAIALLRTRQQIDGPVKWRAPAKELSL